MFKEILNLEGHPNCITDSKVTDDFAEWVDFAYRWSFNGEGSASPACAAVLLSVDNRKTRNQDIFYLQTTMETGLVY